MEHPRHCHSSEPAVPGGCGALQAQVAVSGMGRPHGDHCARVAAHSQVCPPDERVCAKAVSSHTQCTFGWESEGVGGEGLSPVQWHRGGTSSSLYFLL